MSWYLKDVTSLVWATHSTMTTSLSLDNTVVIHLRLNTTGFVSLLNVERYFVLVSRVMAVTPANLGMVIWRLLLPSPPSLKGLIWMM